MKTASEFDIKAATLLREWDAPMLFGVDHVMSGTTADMMARYAEEQRHEWLSLVLKYDLAPIDVARRVVLAEGGLAPTDRLTAMWWYGLRTGLGRLCLSCRMHDGNMEAILTGRTAAQMVEDGYMAPDMADLIAGGVDPLAWRRARDAKDLAALRAEIFAFGAASPGTPSH